MHLVVWRLGATSGYYHEHHERDVTMTDGSKTDRFSTASSMSEADVARQLGVPAATLEMWRRRSAGPRWREVRGMVEYRPADVAAWLAKIARAPTSAQRGSGERLAQGREAE